MKIICTMKVSIVHSILGVCLQSFDVVQVFLSLHTYSLDLVLSRDIDPSPPVVSSSVLHGALTSQHFCF